MTTMTHRSIGQARRLALVAVTIAVLLSGCSGADEEGVREVGSESSGSGSGSGSGSDSGSASGVSEAASE